jgi:F-type H+-transporting ATPase subunit beta
LERFLTQPFFTTEQFTGLKGKLVSLEEALDGCERILRDEFKDYPESALYMIGPIGEAKRDAQRDAKRDTKTGAEPSDTAAAERHLQPGAKLQSEGAHAADADES